MIGRLHDPKLCPRPSVDDGTSYGGRRELVVSGDQHEDRAGRRVDVDHRQRGSDRDHRRDALVDGAQRDGGTERIPHDGDRTGGPPSKLVDGRDDVTAFAGAAVERRSEVEPQGVETEYWEVTEHGVDHGVESVPAVLRVGVTDHDTADVVTRGCCEVGRQFVTVRRREQYGLHRTDGTLTPVAAGDQKIPIKMLNDRLLVKLSKEDGERTSTGGILIPATAQMAKRLVWAEVVALGQNVRSAEMGDQVLFSPDDRYEVEVGGEDYVMLRERDLHAVAAQRIEASTGLYL